MKRRVFRPNLDDVERLSYGNGTRKRGTGSKYVCHRLNQEERKLYDLAKKAGYLSIRGTGYRKQRKGSPLCNTFRQRCDALEKPCLIVEKRKDGDRVLIDFSTLRVKDDSFYVHLVFNNLLKTKYPDLYEIAEDRCKDSSIDWVQVQKNPIWDVNERILAVDCDRDVAKCLAVDILRENIGFHTNVMGSESKITDEFLHDLIPSDGQTDSAMRSTEEKIYLDKCSGGIDWDDI
uniref:Uncharacterized protein n=1 Tax=Corethron hystrix TaxID=216773 RepID=A0A7S1BHJ3_9STRA|mmetsp:Transcript_28189/g.64486  ORF Transcript_28189/g.64486 Transcript_28189/m.64486 type:complete len:233 (+) Transcript_28189:69-767(+)